ncbi:MAG: tRNA threonylcarbamoyladenosine biosynthesis protein TsaB [Acidobacteriaceae bacterium]|jgi:tRNA threonylcarbamoyladenosine biosynthesis protein TsaB
MLLLVVDTSGKQGSIALARGNENESCEVVESVALGGGMFSAQLVPQVASLLSKHGFTRQKIEAFVAVSGPGSFTGLRVGLAAIKGLAEVLDKPIAAVSLLEVVAASASASGNVRAVLDAGREGIYVGEYEVSAAGATLISENLVRREAFMGSGYLGQSALATPDTNIGDALRAKGLGFLEVETLSIASVARLGWKKLLSGVTVSPEALEANYIGRSDSQIFSNAKP